MRYRLTLAAAILFALCAGAGPCRREALGGPARDYEAHDEELARRALEKGEVLPLERIMAQLRDKVPGEISGIELEKEKGIWIYEFKIISPGGRMTKVRVNAATGQIVRNAGD